MVTMFRDNYNMKLDPRRRNRIVLGPARRSIRPRNQTQNYRRSVHRCISINTPNPSACQILWHRARLYPDVIETCLHSLAAHPSRSNHTTTLVACPKRWAWHWSNPCVNCSRTKSAHWAANWADQTASLVVTPSLVPGLAIRCPGEITRDKVGNPTRALTPFTSIRSANTGCMMKSGRHLLQSYPYAPLASWAMVAPMISPVPCAR